MILSFFYLTITIKNHIQCSKDKHFCVYSKCNAMTSQHTSFHIHIVFNMAEWDLTSKLGKYLDRHLVFPLLEFLSVKEVLIIT